MADGNVICSWSKVSNPRGPKLPSNCGPPTLPCSFSRKSMARTAEHGLSPGGRSFEFSCVSMWRSCANILSNSKELFEVPTACPSPDDLDEVKLSRHLMQIDTKMRIKDIA